MGGWAGAVGACDLLSAALQMKRASGSDEWEAVIPSPLPLSPSTFKQKKPSAECSLGWPSYILQCRSAKAGLRACLRMGFALRVHVCPSCCAASKPLSAFGCLCMRMLVLPLGVMMRERVVCLLLIVTNT